MTITNHQQQWKKRAQTIFILVSVFFCIIIVRLADLQIVNGSVYVKRADSNRYYNFSIPAERGSILDRYDDPLVFNSRAYYELLYSERLFGQKRYVRREEALELMAEGAVVGYDLSRNYLFSRSLAHVLGYVGPVSVEDLNANKSLGINDVVGKMGLEKKYDLDLQGEKGKETYEINALGKKQKLSQRIDSSGGESLKTTLDPYLSEIAFRALGNNQGAVIVLDSSNSEILAMVDSPSFDANIFAKILEDEASEAERRKKLNELVNDQRNVFFNRALGGSYPPGSVFKLITALAGLESEKIDKNTSVLDEGVLKVGDYSYANWFYTQHGRTDGNVNLVKALARSNDIYFYKSAEWTGPNQIADMARRFGFGKIVGLELPGEARGLVPDPAWKEKTIGERWFLGNTYHYGIGQGDLLVSPLQVAQMVQGIANKGRLCAPSLIYHSNNGLNECADLGLSDKNVDLVMEGMLAACSQGGTGYTFFQHNLNYSLPEILNQSNVDLWQLVKNGAVACKTGTAEFGGADHRGYRKTHGWFVATMGVKNLIAKDIVRNEEVGEASPSAEGATKNDLISLQALNLGSNQQLRNQWLEKVEKKGFPEQLVIVVLVESDDDKPYKEGSRDAGPVATQIIDWIEGKM